jgi:hypothetical protein
MKRKGINSIMLLPDFTEKKLNLDLQNPKTFLYE